MPVHSVTAVVITLCGSTTIALGSCLWSGPPNVVWATAKITVDDGPKQPTPLAAAIDAFNADAMAHHVGRTQPALTESEVVAVLRWTLLEQGTSPPAITRISDSNPMPWTFDLLREIVGTRTLPPNVELSSMAGYEPNDDVVFEVWSIRLRISRKDGSSFVVSIREQMIGSRAIGDAEREVVRRWRELFAAGVGSMQRAALMTQYRQERDAAIRRDQARAEEDSR